MIVLSLLGRAVALTLITGAAVQAGESKLIAWADLIDETAQTYEDPYRNLSYDQINDLRTVLVKRGDLEGQSLTGDARATAESVLDAALSRLADASIDADYLIAQRWLVAERREKAATAANPELDGKTVTLAGYAIPGPVDADGAIIVYLVPERGMCSHTPPPNANQMIRARVSSDWMPSTMHEPIRLTGTLSVEETIKAFHIVDGPVPMRASYLMEVTGVESIEDLRAGTPKTNEWAASIAEGLRSKGRLPIQTEGVGE